MQYRYDVVVCNLSAQTTVLQTNSLKDAKANAKWYAKRNDVCVQVFDNRDNSIVFACD